MTTIGNESRPAYVYDAETDTWVPIGVGPHTHDEYIDKTIINAKGDIVVGTAADAVARLGVGPEGSVLIADPTSPTGLAWGEAGGSITVSTTAPEEPGEGDLWFNSTNATTYIYYDGFWVEQSPAIAGPKGEPGVVASASEPSDTDVLWLDTDEESDVPVPAGGTTGQVLIKSSSDDYDTDWVNPPSGNAIINGAFDIWQRGTSGTALGTFVADRWRFSAEAGTTMTVSRQTFTPGDEPVVGGSQFFLRAAISDNTGRAAFAGGHTIEDVRTFAGQTVTLSYYAKANTAVTGRLLLAQDFGSGGSAFNVFINDEYHSITTSWQRFTATFTVPSISGKTIGAGSNLLLQVGRIVNANATIDIWGVQLEAGPTANVFRRNANSLQGELAACQRYFYRATNTSENANSLEFVAIGQNYATVAAVYMVRLPVEMRSSPTLAISSTSHFVTSNATFGNVTLTGLSLTTSGTTKRVARLDTSVASGLVAGNITFLTSNNASGTLDLVAEL
jgi:hypothetical protein